MKNSIKIVIGVAGFFCFSIQVAVAGIPFIATRAAVGAAKLAFISSRTVLKQGIPLARDAYYAAKPVINELYVASKPHIARAVELAKAHPTEAKGMAFGATLGYMTSDDGIVNTTVGTGLGALAFLYPWARIAHARQVVLITEKATQLAKAKVAIGATVCRTHKARKVFKNTVSMMHTKRVVPKGVQTQTFSELISATVARVKTEVKTEIQGVRETFRVLSLAGQVPAVNLSQALYFAA